MAIPIDLTKAKIVDLHGKPINLGDPPTTDEQGNTVIPSAPHHFLHGVQIWEKGRLEGVALYRNMADARRVRDILNAKYAELHVDHEAKILNYPVY